MWSAVQPRTNPIRRKRQHRNPNPENSQSLLSFHVPSLPLFSFGRHAPAAVPGGVSARRPRPAAAFLGRKPEKRGRTATRGAARQPSTVHGRQKQRRVGDASLFFFFFSRRELLLCFWHAAYRAMMMTDTKEGKRRGRHVHTEGTLCGRKMPQMDESQQIMVAGQS